MSRYILIFIILFNGISIISFGQVKLKGYVSFNYSYGIPNQDLKNFIPHQSFHGASFEYRHFFKRNFSLGLHLGWNAFKTIIPRAVYETNIGTVSAVQNRYFYSFPFLATGYYYFRSSKYIMPYIGGGLGLYDVNYRKWFGVISFKRESLFFGISPEVGLLIPFKNSGLGITVNGRFNNVFYSYNEIKHLRYFETCIGLYIGNF